MTEHAEHAERRLLQRRFTPDLIRSSLLPRGAWRPYPKASDRAGWEALPAETRAALIQRAEKRLGHQWEPLPATLFMEYRRNGNRTRYQQPHFARRTALSDLVLGECAEGQGRFVDDVINEIWALCEESFWGVPAHNARHSPRFAQGGLPDTSFHEVDLFAAETGALLAWTHYLLADEIERRAPEARVVPDRILRETRARILTPYREFNDWVWLGEVRKPVNNWNPWIHSNVLACTLLLDTDETVRRETVERCVRYLDVFLDGYDDDGGCDEGPGYWGRAGASLFDCLQWLYSASSGALSAYDEPLVQEIGRYIYRVHIGDTWYVNYADASAKVFLEGHLVYRYGERIGDAAMMAQGAYAVTQRGQPWGRTSIGRELPALFDAPGLSGVEPKPPLVREAWLDGIQVLCARERQGSVDGLYLSAKGGHNAESHNHNDVGNFVVAVDGNPVLIDVGVEEYTRKTFSPQRYEIWTMQSAYHNVPIVDGVGQANGRGFEARDVKGSVTDGRAALELDIAGAYPPGAGIQRWRRKVWLDRGERQVGLTDEYRLDREPKSVALHLMASGPVDVAEEGVLRCQSPTRPLVVSYPSDLLNARVEDVKVEDSRLVPIWGERVYRVILEARTPAQEGTWTLTMRAG